MNKKRKSFKVMMLALCMIALVMVQSPQAMATDEPTVIVSNYSELEQAIEQASDGDVIGYDGNIDIDVSVTIGENGKHVTLKKMNEDAHFNFSKGTSIVQNVIFDGDLISTSYPLVIVSAETTFQNVIFQNGNVIWSDGGAVSLRGGVTNFIDCIFKDNSGQGGQGGHLYVSGYSKATVENCLFKNGNASHGGAIANYSNDRYGLIIQNSTITENSAVHNGGGIYNNGYLEIHETKIFNNIASNGGADIANTSSLLLVDSIEELVELFKDEGIIPIGWVNDYEDDSGLGGEYLKLDYEIPPTEVILESESLGIASDSKVAGLESGKYYMVTMGDIISYSKADGTLTPNEPEAEALIGTEIIGLTNGETYKVEEYTPAPIEEEPTPEEPIDEPDDKEPEPQPEEPPVEEEPIEDDEPTPEPPIIEDEEEPIIKDPEPSNPPSSSNDRPRRNSSPVVKKEEPAPAVVLSNGKAILDTTKTEYLLGYTDGLLGSKGTVTKAELVQIVYRLLTPESNESIYSGKNKFKDVDSSDWYNEAVSTLTNAGLISMGADGKFNPDKNITWGEMITILAKFAEPNHEWKIITKHWARDSINTAISYRWFEYNDQFNPDGEVTRFEMLNFINTLFDWAAKQ